MSDEADDDAESRAPQGGVCRSISADAAADPPGREVSGRDGQKPESDRRGGEEPPSLESPDPGRDEAFENSEEADPPRARDESKAANFGLEAAELTDFLDGLTGTVGPSESAEPTLLWDPPGRIVYEPTVRQTRPECYQMEGKRESGAGIPWGFWGGVLAAGVGGMMIVEQQYYFSWQDVLWPALAVVVGLVVFRFGRRTTLQVDVLCVLDAARRTVSWPGEMLPSGEPVSVPFGEVTEVVFGMTRLPLSLEHRDVRVDAFTLLVRTREDELIPVVEGSPYKEQVHAMAELLVDATGVELTYVGRGVKDGDEAPGGA